MHLEPLNKLRSPSGSIGAPTVSCSSTKLVPERVGSHLKEKENMALNSCERGQDMDGHRRRYLSYLVFVEVHLVSFFFISYNFHGGILPAQPYVPLISARPTLGTITHCLLFHHARNCYSSRLPQNREDFGYLVACICVNALQRKQIQLSCQAQARSGGLPITPYDDMDSQEQFPL